MKKNGLVFLYLIRFISRVFLKKLANELHVMCIIAILPVLKVKMGLWTNLWYLMLDGKSLQTKLIGGIINSIIG